MNEEISYNPQHEDQLAAVLELTEKLNKVIFEYSELTEIFIPNLEALYLQKFGNYELQRFHLEIAVRRIKRKVQLLQASLNRGEVPVPEEIEEQLEQEMKEWKEKFENMRSNLEAANLIKFAEVLTVEQTNDLKRMFRDFVKVLHPDLNGELDEEKTKLWNDVLAAYREGNLFFMKTLYTINESLFDDEQQQAHSLSLDQLDKKIEFLKESISKYSQSMELLKQQHPYDKKDFLHDEIWIEIRITGIQKKISDLKKYKKDLEFRLETIEGLFSGSGNN